MPSLFQFVLNNFELITDSYQTIKERFNERKAQVNHESKLECLADCLNSALSEDIVISPIGDDFTLPIVDPWISPTATCTIQGITINNGMFYCGTLLPQRNSSINEPFLIDPSLPAVQGTLSSADLDITPFGYEHISPACRFAFLSWLASDRTNTNVPKKIVWLYLCGLERRLLIDCKKRSIPESSRLLIMREIRRIAYLFADHLPILEAAERLICMYWAMTHNPQFVMSVPDNLYFESDACASLFPYLLSCYAMTSRPIPWHTLLVWFHRHPNFGLPQKVLNHMELFKKIFEEKFKKYRPESFTITSQPIDLIIRYQAANPTIGELVYRVPGAYDVFMQTKLLAPVSIIVNAAADELEARLKKQARKPKPTPSASNLLPPDKLSQQPLQKLHDYLSKKCEQNTAIINVIAIINVLGIPAPNAFDDNNAAAFSECIERAGFLMAPDIRLHGVGISPDGFILVAPITNAIQPSERLRIIATFIQLGAIVAQYDNVISPKEIDYLQKTILKRQRLTDDEKSSLLLWLHWCLHTPQTIDHCTIHLDNNLSENIKAQISRMLIETAAADNAITPPEKQCLVSLYRSIGLNPDWVARDIDEFECAHGKSFRAADKPEYAFSTIGTTDDPTNRISDTRIDVPDSLVNALLNWDQIEKK